MINIRPGMFETNSSSTHSLVLIKEEDWEKIQNGELFIDIFDVEDDGKRKDRPVKVINKDEFMAEAKREYTEDYLPGLRKLGFNDGHEISWEEHLERYKKYAARYDTNTFGMTGERFINKKSTVWHYDEVVSKQDECVLVDIDHYFG